MSSTFFIRLGSCPGQDASWLSTGPEGEAQGACLKGPLSAVSALAAGARVVVLLPGELTVLAAVDLPVKGAARQLQAAPFAMEEFVAEDVSQLHFAIGSRREDGRIPVAAASRSTFSDSLDQLEAHGISPSVVCSELQGLPEIPGAITAIVETDQVLLRLTDEQRLAVEPSMLETVLAGALQSAGDLEDAASRRPSIMFYLDAAVAMNEPAWVTSIRASYPEAEFRQMADGTLAHLAAGLRDARPINFLQGDFAPRSDWQKILRPWRIPGALAASLVLVVCLVQAASLWRLSAREATLDQAIAESVSVVFAGQSRVNDPRRELDRLLANLRGEGQASSNQFLDSAAALGGILPGMPGTRIEAASYRNQTLDLRLKVPDVDTLDRLQRELQGAGNFRVSIQSANPRSDGVEGRIEISRSGS